MPFLSQGDYALQFQIYRYRQFCLPIIPSNFTKSCFVKAVFENLACLFLRSQWMNLFWLSSLVCLVEMLFKHQNLADKLLMFLVIRRMERNLRKQLFPGITKNQCLNQGRWDEFILFTTTHSQELFLGSLLQNKNVFGGKKKVAKTKQKLEQTKTPKPQTHLIKTPKKLPKVCLIVIWLCCSGKWSSC